jgi:DNA-binding MarR family transcriptional regulator
MTDFDQELYQMITRTRQVITKARKAELKKYGVAGVYVAAMNVIVKLKKRATPANIARALFLEPHSVSELLSKMEEVGLIRRVKDLERKNYVRAELTEEGQKKYGDSHNIESIRDMMSVLSPEEKKQLWELLSRIRTQALSQLGVDDKSIFPPANPGR